MRCFQALLPFSARAWTARFQAFPPDVRGMALEATLERMADRLAQAELALWREQSLSRHASERAAKAEAALERLRAELEGSGSPPPLHRARGTSPVR